MRVRAIQPLTRDGAITLLPRLFNLDREATVVLVDFAYKNRR
jgi:hypothetical protein